MSIQEKLLYTNEAFWEITQLPENRNKRLELVDGVIREMASSSKLNTVIAAKILSAMYQHAEANDLGYVVGADSGFDLGVGYVRQPDCAFINKARVPTLEGNTFVVGPDLAVEVISPSESPRDILDKARRYLQTGGQMVWAVYPVEKVVDVYTLNEKGSLVIDTFDINAMLDAGKAFPGFSLPVQKIFPQ